MHSKKLHFVPDADHIVALEYYRNLYGRAWKAKICDMWVGAKQFPKYDDIMRGIRNAAGPTWLQRFSIDKAIKARKEASIYCSFHVNCNGDDFQGDDGARRLAQLFIEAAEHLRAFSDLKKLEHGLQHSMRDTNGNYCSVLRITRKDES